MAIHNKEINYIKIKEYINYEEGCEIFIYRYASENDRLYEKEFTENFQYFLQELKSIASSVPKETLTSIVADISKMTQHVSVSNTNIEIYNKLEHFKESFMKGYQAGVVSSMFFIGEHVENLSEAYAIVKRKFKTKNKFTDC